MQDYAHNTAVCIGYNCGNIQIMVLKSKLCVYVVCVTVLHCFTLRLCYGICSSNGVFT